jgi:hypothetical protein
MWPSTLAGSDASPIRRVPPVFGVVGAFAATGVAGALAAAGVAPLDAVAGAGGEVGAAAGALVGAAGTAGAPHAITMAAPAAGASNLSAARRVISFLMQFSPMRPTVGPRVRRVKPHVPQ